MDKTVHSVGSACYHCGESCSGNIVFQNHTFCCEGCKTVYYLLDSNNLCDYYSLNQAPGFSLRAISKPKQFAYLDDGEIKSKLLKFSDNSISTVTFSIPRIHCSSCIYLLENLHKVFNGVLKCNVNFLKREASIVFEHEKISLAQLAESLTSIGYEPHINLTDLEEKPKQDLFRSYYIKIGIAFFVFGNIMLLSFPEYLGLDVLSESPLRKFFGYLSFLLALPVMFYCASEFYLSAWNALRQRTLNMDIPIVLGLIAMFVRSSYEVFSHTGGGYFDTLASLVMLMLIGRFFQNKTYYNLSFERDYRSYFPVAVTVTQHNRELQIPLSKLRVGDHIVVRNMELVPADAVLFSGNCNIDYSFVTGEATPIVKRRGDIIYAGGKQVGSAVEMEIIKNVSQSYLTQLWNDAAFGNNQSEHITSLATRVSKWFTPLVILIATGAMVFWWNKDMHKALNAFTSVLIITCPCALALSSPFTLGNVLRILGRHKIYLKNAFTIEKLAQVNAVVFDKTGTLTNTKEAKIDFIPLCGNSLSPYHIKLVKSVVYHSSHPLSSTLGS